MPDPNRKRYRLFMVPNAMAAPILADWFEHRSLKLIGLDSDAELIATSDGPGFAQNKLTLKVRSPKFDLPPAGGTCPLIDYTFAVEAN